MSFDLVISILYLIKSVQTLILLFGPNCTCNHISCFHLPNFISQKSVLKSIWTNFVCFVRCELKFSLPRSKNAIRLHKINPFQHSVFLLTGSFLLSFLLGKIWVKAWKVLHLCFKTERCGFNVFLGNNYTSLESIQPLLDNFWNSLYSDIVSYLLYHFLS